MKVTVSIALPVYNGERFVADAIESVLSQDFADFELLISDNASTDATADICRRYVERDTRVRYVRNARNIGIAANFTQSFNLVSGHYFKWMAADDMLGGGYLRKCVEMLENDPSVVLVTPRATLVEQDGKTPLRYDAVRGVFIGSYAGRPIENADPYMGDRPSDRFRGVLLRMPGNAINNFGYGLMRAEIVRRQMPFGAYIGADKVFLAGLSLHGKLAILDEFLFIWRHHDEQFSRMSHDDAMRAIDPAAPNGMWINQISAYAKVVRGSSLPPAEKIRCLSAIAEKVFRGWGSVVHNWRVRRRG